MKYLINLFVSILFIILLSLIYKIPVAANEWIKYENNPVVNSGPANSWNSNSVGSPSVLSEGAEYKMWFQGDNRLIGRIGYATSIDGKSWSSPQILLNTLSPNSNENDQDPKVLYKNGYQIWFSASIMTIGKLYVNHSSSSDGINWSNPELNVIPPTLSWENNKGISFPYVIFDDNKYKMWYGAHGEYLGVNRWRIGYATSNDGISNWVKYNTPVLESTENWEGFDSDGGVANPVVILENNDYHMFYHGNTGIGHAFSYDGINWYKDPNNPILKASTLMPPAPTPTPFDTRRVLNPYVIKNEIENKYYMYYSGIGVDNKWRIGLAINDALPTPYITLTPTPSPTPPPFSPIIIIPGLGASWNAEDIFSCSLTSSGNWQLAPYVFLYNRLIKTLTDNAHLQMNKDVYLYAYDWRLPLDQQGEKLKNFIDGIAAKRSDNVKFRLIGHSLGGLLVRSYVTNNYDSHKVDKAITVGTPHEGSVLAYPMWEKGEVWSDDRLMKLAVTQLVKFCRLKLMDKPPPKTEREIVQLIAPSVRSLMPTFSFLRQNGSPITLSGQNQNDWSNGHKFSFPDSFPAKSLTTLSGNNVNTLRYLEVVKPSKKDISLGDWTDGKPTKKEKIRDGDGTVLTLSSKIESVNNIVINADHGEIISSDQAIREILKFLDLPNIQPAQKLAVPEETSDKILLVSIDQSAKMKLADPKKKLSQSNENIVVSYNPEIGLYKLTLISQKTTPANLHILQMDDKNTDDKIYPVKLVKNKPMEYLLIYNPATSTLPKFLNL